MEWKSGRCKIYEARSRFLMGNEETFVITNHPRLWAGLRTGLPHETLWWGNVGYSDTSFDNPTNITTWMPTSIIVDVETKDIEFTTLFQLLAMNCQVLSDDDTFLNLRSKLWGIPIQLSPVHMPRAKPNLYKLVYYFDDRRLEKGVSVISSTRRIIGECIICYSTSHTCVRYRCCKVVVCVGCLNEWTRTSSSCPHCRCQSVAVYRFRHFDFETVDFSFTSRVICESRYKADQITERMIRECYTNVTTVVYDTLTFKGDNVWEFLDRACFTQGVLTVHVIISASA